MTFDPTKPVQTRDGRKARIICTDRRTTVYSILALITENDGYEYIESYTKAGHRYGDEDCDSCSVDLINIPEEPKTAKVWVAVFEADGEIYCTSSYLTRKQALENGGRNAIACVPVTITYRPGEGLEDA
ncbi:hypothetical protein HBA54_04275 [Pelagibius litoralis]|uniref:Uncharacterized protein n=1 Tax=Pelagibius litoralis TaxID=374515 RepID=A0A967CAZ6_9PROT|nr:hypothetical protein [Pelagibius litoralis]NIA67799.1 hypothetical protein [Pelagibius litoralis]